VSALQSVLARLQENAASAARRVRVRSFSTVSAGYDSSATTGLVHALGVEAAFTSRRSNSSLVPWMNRDAAIDDGTPIAAHFGMPVIYLEQEASSVGRDELYFLAATAADAELVFYPMARHIEEQCEAAIVFTGFHGDKIWDLNTTGEYLGRQMKRGDTSGLNLGEIRLKAGFINVPIPFIFADSVRMLVEIARSQEMAPWRIGGDYDRPIPRRILEDQGVPRRAFGTRKKAVVQSYNYPVNRSLREEFLRWLRARHGWSPLKVYSFEKINKVMFLVLTAAERLLDKAGVATPAASRVLVGRDVDLPYELHIWALDQLMKAYARRDEAPEVAIS
jgi:hypothetical protein